ncbi:hypothetical protein [Streptomyces sp. Ac-502]|uniref:hypothetical protein n=1 Tax=Streptomyces sp. Ac-502 TaxID=3342801 RepID=UPI0038627531
MDTRQTVIRMFMRPSVTVRTEGRGAVLDTRHTKAVISAMETERDSEADALTERGCSPTSVRARKWKPRSAKLDLKPTKPSPPKPSTTPYAAGSWVTWTHPDTGQKMAGIVSRGEAADIGVGGYPYRAIIPNDGSDILIMRPRPGTSVKDGEWIAIYDYGISAQIQPHSVQLEFSE